MVVLDQEAQINPQGLGSKTVSGLSTVFISSLV